MSTISERNINESVKQESKTKIRHNIDNTANDLNSTALSLNKDEKEKAYFLFSYFKQQASFLSKLKVFFNGDSYVDVANKIDLNTLKHLKYILHDPNLKQKLYTSALNFYPKLTKEEINFFIYQFNNLLLRTITHIALHKLLEKGYSHQYITDNLSHLIKPDADIKDLHNIVMHDKYLTRRVAILFGPRKSVWSETKSFVDSIDNINKKSEFINRFYAKTHKHNSSNLYDDIYQLIIAVIRANIHYIDAEENILFLLIGYLEILHAKLI